ncbi:hypothetical protein B649_08505 [Candidatus Sulfuricurvum sp. RIFRC-1]|uniref:imidazole glycerol phosphate synthase subunit HisH n=1 Tax=Candidatus Sulfuricurvum sp. RIFRC-1 TaxID=1249480 RepID=UPI0002998044|nr:imidazole glycerol phosphate synthase subunit HisH [Candidatus Sulfuricurvum sp. RIFRC-1]AFV98013.1 hypothetical protein B649_08505 [Candidatus Sulfuricurvum sp. RIFRC-1]
MNVAIIDYGMGNIKSVVSALKYIGVTNITLSNQYDVLDTADKLILPGVGSFKQAMETIKRIGLDQSLHELVINRQKPILGICLGMQLMTRSSTEEAFTAGLGFIDAEVTRFEQHSVRIPHVGFNQVRVNPALNLYHEMEGEIDFYFTHSYKALSAQQINQCMCDYDGEFIASYEQNNIAGVQFHPELSQNNGLKLLQNFIERF